MAKRQKFPELTEIHRTGRMRDVGNALARRGALGPQVFEESAAGGQRLDAAIAMIHEEEVGAPAAPRINERKRLRIVRAHARGLVPYFVDDTERGESTLAVAALTELPDEIRSRAVEGFAALLETDATAIQNALTAEQDWADLLERMDQEPRRGRRA